jgi:hypothetical protein
MLDQNIIEVENKWAQLVVTNAKSILLRNKKIATGALYNSVRYVVNAKGQIEFLYAPEGKWVTQGRRKGARFPPPGPISQWIKTKGIKAVSSQGKPISEKSLTYLISRGISEKGIKPLPFMKLAIRQSIQQLRKELKKAATKNTVDRLRAAARGINKT